MTTIRTTEARAALPELLDRVERGEEVTITRHGRAVAVLVRPDTLRARRHADAALAAASDLQRRLGAAREGAPPNGDEHRGALTPERAEELVADVRAARDA